MIAPPAGYTEVPWGREATHAACIVRRRATGQQWTLTGPVPFGHRALAVAALDAVSGILTLTGQAHEFDARAMWLEEEAAK